MYMCRHKYIICIYIYTYMCIDINIDISDFGGKTASNQMDNGIFCCNIIASMTQFALLLGINVLNESCCLSFCCCQLSLSGDSFSQLWHDFGIAWDLEIGFRSHRPQCLRKNHSGDLQLFSHESNEWVLVFPPQIAVFINRILLDSQNLE